jgi:AcrR family transcriptional regulator
MPKLWNETIEAHRRDLREAIIGATAELIGRAGPFSVTMSQIAAKAGIGRATLYKYFPDVESILHAWHQARIAGHLAEMQRIHEAPGEPMEQLEALLLGYVELAQHGRRHHHADLSALLHRTPDVATAHQQVLTLIEKSLLRAGKTGTVRNDIPRAELAAFCLAALAEMGAPAAPKTIRRRVKLVLAALRPKP